MNENTLIHSIIYRVINVLFFVANCIGFCVSVLFLMGLISMIYYIYLTIFIEYHEYINTCNGFYFWILSIIIFIMLHLISLILLLYMYYRNLSLFFILRMFITTTYIFIVCLFVYYPYNSSDECKQYRDIMDTTVELNVGIFMIIVYFNYNEN